MVDPVSGLAALGTIGTFAGIGTTVYYQRKTQRLLDERNAVSWDELRSEARSLRADVRRQFDPDLVLTPGVRGATVMNLMQDVDENIPLYVGIREELRVPDEGRLAHDPVGYALFSETAKYRHYFPEELLHRTDESVLLLDAFTDTGASLRTIRDRLVDAGYDPGSVKRATVLCSETAVEDGHTPDFYSLEVSRPFYFPWGKAV